MKPIHKFNNGNGAMICNNCRTIISTGPKTDDLLCKKCSTNKRYYVLMEYEPSWMWTMTHTSDGDELDWSIVNYNLKEVSPRVEIAEEDIAKEQDKNKYSEEDLKEAFYQGWVLSGAEVSFREAINKWFDDLKTNKI
jgi:hypothetical protein